MRRSLQTSPYLKSHSNGAHDLQLFGLSVLENYGNVKKLVERDSRDKFEICNTEVEL